MATHRTATSASGWSKAAPKRGPQRRTLYKKCGRGAFLVPHAKKPGTSGYPIVARGRGCKPDCRGLLAAESRANSQCTISKEVGQRARATRECAAAKRAKTIAKRGGCRWAR